MDRAVTKLGGPHQASLKTGIPYATLQSLRSKGVASSYEIVRKLSEASGVPMDVLAGLDRKTA